ncbi:MAG TPA: diaminopimelate decarboxylase [Thermoanaerobaculia bacterium]|jgi:diaminopimelate decarboxylase|nr:diaminopimelate decarboxylase [Thermoanaerobaculia bacterium]
MAYRNHVLYIGDHSAEALAARFGTPLYVYDAAVIRRQMERVTGAFAGLPFRPFYAMKANGNLSILRMLREGGFGCDCVSPGEIHLAMRAGYTPDAIWFTCSNVSDDDLRAIPDPGIVVNVNSMSEIDRCLALDLRNPIALRVNPDVGAGHHADVITAGGGVKFGIDLAELDSARILIEDTGRRVVGLHMHIGSGVDTPAPLLRAARRLLELAPTFANLEWLNFGGGLATPYRLDEPEFPIEQYGAELTHIAGAMLRARNLTAILEPGRYLVAQSGTLLARATAKRISIGVEWIGVDTGFNHLVRPSKYSSYHHILNATRGETERCEDAVVAGNLCESSDVFTRIDGHVVTRTLDPVRVGDLLAFCDAGAYGFSMASHYNARLLPPEVMVDGEAVTLIRARQTFDDLVRGME